MRGAQVEIDIGPERSAWIGSMLDRIRPFPRIVEHRPDRIGDHRVLRFEMRVEATMRQPGACHHARDRDAIGSLRADLLRGLFQHPPARLCLVLVRIAHLNASFI